MTVAQVQAECQDKMDKTVAYLERELRGIRTGRATTALVDYVKVDYYGSPTDLKDMAGISVPEPTQLLIKPFDPSSVQTIVKAIETADLGLNPAADGGAIRINVPAPSTERRQQLVGQVRKMAEDSKVSVRNERRDAMKHIDQMVKDDGLSEDIAKKAKEAIDERTKKHTSGIEEITEKKVKEIETI